MSRPTAYVAVDPTWTSERNDGFSDYLDYGITSNSREQTVVRGCNLLTRNLGLVVSAAMALLTSTSIAAATCGGHGTRESMLVNTSWLLEHSHDQNLVTLAVGK